MITRYLKLVVTVSLLAIGLEAAAPQGDLDQHLAAFAQRKGVTLKDGKLTLYETYSAGTVKMLAAITALLASMTYYCATTKDTSMQGALGTGATIAGASVTGYGLFAILDAYNVFTPAPVLVTLSTEGIRFRDSLIAWQQISDCEIEQNVLSIGDITLPLPWFWYTPASPALTQNIDVLKLFDRYGRQLLALNDNHLPLTARELKTLIEAFKHNAAE